MVGTLQPLSSNFAIVDENGRPTPYFIKLFQQKQQDIVASVDSTGVTTVVNDTLADREVIAGTALNGGGPLSADVTLNHNNSTVTPGVYGDTTHVPKITVDQQGHITNVVNTPVSGGSSTSLGITNLYLTSNAVGTGSWRTISGWTVLNDSLGAYPTDNGQIIVPTGATYARASVFLAWNNLTSTNLLRYFMLSGTSALAADPLILAQAGVNAYNEGLTSLTSCIISVTAGTNISPWFLTSSSDFLSGQSNGVFGKPTRLQIEWFSSWPT